MYLMRGSVEIHDGSCSGRIYQVLDRFFFLGRGKWGGGGLALDCIDCRLCGCSSV